MELVLQVEVMKCINILESRKMSKNLPLTAGAQLLKTASRARDLSYILEESLGKVLK